MVPRPCTVKTPPFPGVSRRGFLAAAAAAALPLQAAPTGSFVRVSPRDRRYLALSDGSPYIPIGLNLVAPERYVEDAEGGFRLYQFWMDKLAANGGNYIRPWISSPFWDVEHAHSGEFDEEKAKRIDWLLEKARERGIRAKLTIEHFRSIGDGRQAWADKPLHNVANGGTAQSIEDYFNGEKSRALFIRKLDWFQKRFGERPEIYAWELWNEINAVRGGNYMAWTETMLPELHRRFPQNLCVQSLGSFDRDNARPNYRRMATMPGNDVAQVHRYLDLGAALEICHGPVDMLAADAVRELLSYEPRKPVILAETGAVEPSHSGPFKLYRADKDGTLLHDLMFAAFFAGAAGPGQTWHWDSYVDPNNLWWHFRRFSDVVEGIDPAAESFIPTMVDHDRLRIYRLEGRSTILIWCRDARNDWRSELERGEAPQTLTGLRIEEPSTRGTIRAYDPWTGNWTAANRTSGHVQLPDFRRSLVLRIA